MIRGNDAPSCLTHRRRGQAGIIMAVATVLLLVMAASPPARAQDQAAVDKLVTMNQKAVDDYDTLEWGAAKKTLLEALAFAMRSGLEAHPMTARTYVHLGAVYVVGYSDRARGVQALARALEIDPGIKIGKSLATAELEDAFAQAARDAKARPPAAASPPTDKRPVTEPEAAAPRSKPAEPQPPPPVATKTEPVPPAPPARKRAPADSALGDAPPPPPRRVIGDDGDDSGEPDLPVRINALDCPAADETPPDRSVSMRCAASPELGVTKVLLFFRDAGKEEFSSVSMEKTRKGWFVGRIPKRVVKGKSLQYYFEGRDKGGKPIVSNGRSDSPNLMLIREGAAGDLERSGGREEDGDENPLDPGDDEGPRILLGRIDRSKIGVDTRYGNRRWWIGLGVGSGIGYARGDGPEARQDLKDLFVPGAGLASLGHLAPEIGIHLGPSYAVSIQGRHQYIPQSGEYARFVASGAHSVLLRLLAFTRQKRTRFYGAVMAGGGEGFRLVLYPDPYRKTFKDTVRGGPLVVGVGLGLTFEVARSVSLVAEVNGLGGLPSISAVADLNLGLQLNFD